MGKIDYNFKISPITNRVPYSSKIVSSVNKDLGNYVCQSNFVVILNEFVYGFQEVSGIDADLPYESLTEGGNQYPVFVHKAQAADSFTILSLKRSMPIRNAGYAAKAFRLAAGAAATLNSLTRKTALLAAAALDPITTLENGPAIGFIQVFNRDYSKDMVSFKFFSYGASKWALGELDATSGNIVYESIDLICDGIERMSTNLTPSGVWNAFDSTIDQTELDNLEKYRDEQMKKFEEENLSYKTKSKENREKIKNESDENSNNNKEINDMKRIIDDAQK